MWEPKRDEGRWGLQEGLGQKWRGGEEEDWGLRRVGPFGGRKPLEVFI